MSEWAKEGSNNYFTQTNKKVGVEIIEKMRSSSALQIKSGEKGEYSVSEVYMSVAEKKERDNLTPNILGNRN